MYISSTKNNFYSQTIIYYTVRTSLVPRAINEHNELYYYHCTMYSCIYIYTLWAVRRVVCTAENEARFCVTSSSAAGALK